MKIAIGCDPNAAQLKTILSGVVLDAGHVVEDFGSDDPIYANTALNVALAVSEGKCDRGILLCGTGLGMCLAANKVPGAYAAVCSDMYSTERSILSNNANIMTIGAFTTGVEISKQLVKRWLELEYVSGGRSEAKVQRIYEIEKQYLSK